MQDKCVNEIFAGINSCDGYESLLEGEIKNCEKVFILKGSPGSGKSTLLKRLLANAVVRGEKVTAVKCSADPDSLDGLIFENKSMAVADGTPPHVLEPTLPGVREILINLAENIDTDILSANRGILERLNARQKRIYKAVYSLLSAAGKIAESEEHILSKGFLDEKLIAFCDRFARKNLRPAGIYSPRLLPAMCLCSRGFVYLPVNGKPYTYTVGDFCGSSEKVISHLCYASLAHGAEVSLIPSPVDIKKPTGLYFPNENILVVSERYITQAGDKAINTFRFIDSFHIKDNRGKLKFLDKLRSELIGQVRTLMNEASETHNDIEKIYTFANDFSKADEAADYLKLEIFGE
ncbi:MAG: hypothetical protein PHW77_06060 [Eubacteriales bacterium]|nr:hypothetical protein [Eubacteriales bacterium]